MTGWKLGDTRITLSDLHSANNYNIHHNNSSNNQNNSHERLPLGVKAGLVADLSQCSPELAAQLIEADVDCASMRASSSYGQLMVLGYREYRLVERNWV